MSWSRPSKAIPAHRANCCWMPADLKDEAARQANASGVSMYQLIATAIAARVGSLAESERYFAVRSQRVEPVRAMSVLARAGKGNKPHRGDELR